MVGKCISVGFNHTFYPVQVDLCRQTLGDCKRLSEQPKSPYTGYQSADIFTRLSNVCCTLLFLLISILSCHYRFSN